MKNNEIRNPKTRVVNLKRLKEKFILELRAEEIPQARNTFTRLMKLYYEYYNKSIKEEFEGADIAGLVKNIGLDFDEAQKNIEEDYKSRLDEEEQK